MTRPQARRIKSSKLAPLKEGGEERKEAKKLTSSVKRRPSGDSRLRAGDNQLSGTGMMNPSLLGTNTMKKPQIRTSYPKLMSMKRTVVE